ncbi:hypothetical protein TPB0596_04740 [Tsukamurella pulmonis]|uniref:hypothetical protein n=1 Tax=Tsukamurella pulmonis TaxID=47312 RepID=UPI001EDCB8EE|nr:hypothetical protein [Tsukamurella pulmonis]BDD80711.1 hypothetical protein TPB0596_04740 [Tsukamurella pulmonis]
MTHDYVNTRTGNDHQYVVRERLGGRKAGEFGTVIRRYDGEGRYGAEFTWIGTRYSDGARCARRTLTSASAFVAAGEAVPATPVITGTCPDPPTHSLRGIAARARCVWVHSAGLWCVLGPADQVVSGATVTVRTALGEEKKVVILGEIERCTVDGHELAWASHHRSLGERRCA